MFSTAGKFYSSIPCVLNHPRGLPMYSCIAQLVTISLNTLDYTKPSSSVFNRMLPPFNKLNLFRKSGVSQGEVQAMF